MNAIIRDVDRDDAGAALARVVLEGDLSKLTPQEKVTHYNATCQSIGVNPLTRPLEYIRLNGKEVLYARKDCTDQLRALRKVSVQIVDRVIGDGLVVVTARASTPDGRHDEEIGAVPLGNLQGEARANAIMKAMTKAKRRVTLSICGLGFLDETEIDGALAGQMREVPNLAPTQRPEPARVVEDAPEWPFLTMAGKEVLLTADKWRASLAKALASLHDADTLAEWRAERGGLLARIHESGGAELVADAERAIDIRAAELAEARA